MVAEESRIAERPIRPSLRATRSRRIIGFSCGSRRRSRNITPETA